MQQEENSLKIEMQTLISKYGQGDDTMVIHSPIPKEHKCDSITSLSAKSETRFTSEESIGAGGMKVINLVKDENMKRTVAKATIHPERINDVSIEMFIREARLTAALEHPNIIPIYDVGKNEKGEPFFIMKHLDGFNLKNLLVILSKEEKELEGVFTQEKLIYMFLEICYAISYAHKQKVLHLDLKPDNIHITSDGKTYVVDWGLSKIIGEKESSSSSKVMDLMKENIDHTMSGEMKGTPGYMATEQIRKNVKLTQQTDVYGLGGILYSILCREIPISESDLERSLRETVRGNITKPSERRPDLKIDKGLERITMKAMQRLPKNRYQSVDEMILDIEKILHKRWSRQKILLMSIMIIFVTGILWFFISDAFQKSQMTNEMNNKLTLLKENESSSSYSNQARLKDLKVSDVMPENVTIMGDNLIAWWKFDKDLMKDGFAKDSSPMGNHAKIINFNENLLMPGVFQQGLTFQDEQSKIKIPYHEAFPTKRLTISLWVHIKQHKEWNRIMSYNWKQGETGWMIKMNKTGHIFFIVKEGDEIFSIKSNKKILRKWNHLGIHYDGRFMRIFLNGHKGQVLIKETTFSKGGEVILSSDNDAYLNGALDDVRIYNGFLKSTQLRVIKRKGEISLNKQNK